MQVEVQINMARGRTTGQAPGYNSRMAARPVSRLNRNVIGMAITSFCADVGYEMVSARFHETGDRVSRAYDAGIPTAAANAISSRGVRVGRSGGARRRGPVRVARHRNRGHRGTAYGSMGAVNGAGDLIASALVGTLWTAVSPVAAFGCAGALMLAGAALMRTAMD